MRRRRRVVVVVLLLAMTGAGYITWRYFTADKFVFIANASLPEVDLSAVDVPAREKPVIQPVLQPYAIAGDLSNVENVNKFRFAPEQVERLRRDGFLLYDAQVGNPTLVYLDSTIPLVTTDIVLHVFHTLAQDTLHKEEQILLRPCLETFLGETLAASAKIHGGVGSKLRGSARANMVRFCVALRLLREDVVPPRSVRQEVDRILDAISNGSTIDFEGRQIDGSPFQVRGDYSHITELAGSGFSGIDEERVKGWMKRRDKPFDDYFRAIIWLRQSGWDIETPEGLLGLAALAEGLNHAPKGVSAFRTFSHVVSIFAEGFDGMTPLDVQETANSLFGKTFKAAELSAAQLDSFKKSLLEKYELRILDRREGLFVGVENAPKLLFALPGRYSLTGDLFQRIQENVETPSGEDYAAFILGATISPKSKSSEAKKLSEEVEHRPEQEWWRSLGGGFQYSLKSLVEPVPEGFPQFTRGGPWQTKSINTALAGFAQLNHLLFLYDKHPSLTAGIGDDPNLFAGYVEPNPEFYSRLAHCVSLFRHRLVKIDHFTRLEEYYRVMDKQMIPLSDFGQRAMEDHYNKLESLLKTLQRISEKELRDVPFEVDEMRTLRTFGQEVRDLTFDTDLLPDERDKSLICDVATNYDLPQRCVQVGTGRPLVLLAVVPRMGQLYLAKGSVVTYHEFTRPLEQRLTDEEWRVAKKDPAESWLGQRGAISAPVSDVR